MLPNELNVRVVDTALNPRSTDPKQEKIQHRLGPAPEKRPLYLVYLYLDGPDLPFVESVTYHLHPTFDPPERTVARTVTNPTCQLEIWTWGVFDIRAIVKAKGGQQFELKHPLTYTQEFEVATFEGPSSTPPPAATPSPAAVSRT